MATTFRTPGVFIQEINNLPNSIVQVDSAIPAFVGYTAKNGTYPPTRITSMLDYESIFGGPSITLEVTALIDNNGIATVALSTPGTGLSNPDTKYKLYYALQMYFANGGGPCYIVPAGLYSSGTNAPEVSLSELTTALNKLIYEDEPTLICIPDAYELTSDSDFYTLMNSALALAATLEDRFVIMDVHPSADTNGNVNVATSSAALRNTLGTNNLKYGAAYYPSFKTVITYPDTAIKFSSASAGSTTSGAHGSPYSTATSTVKSHTLSDLMDPNNSLYAAAQGDLSIIIPKLRALVNTMNITLPPSSTMAGIYAAVDASRGVWKAPANVSVNNIVSLSDKISDADQAACNVDAASGKSINVIRYFTGKGNIVWGARTLAGNDNEWRYINVRRLFITVEESIKKASAFVVFEPNDANTWIKVKASIENYLLLLWKDGALAGAKADDAFYVNVGLGSTMTADDILNGIMNIEIGMAAVRPAEFIVLKFSHKLQQS